MLRIYASLLLIMVITHSAYGDPCDLVDEANFPSTECSVTALGATFSELRFGRIDQLNSADDEDETILRSGISIFLIDEDTEVLEQGESDDGDDQECLTVDISAKQGEEIAYIVEDDSLNAPRRITRIWILGCEVNQPK